MATPRSWFTFSLRTVGIVLTLLLMLLGYWANRAWRQRAAVESILRRGGRIGYGPIAERESPPHWLARYLGRDFVETVTTAEMIGRDFDDEDLRLLDDLNQIDWLRLYETNITGRNFRHVSRLKKLRSLLVHHSPLTDEGMEEIGKLRDLELLYMVDINITDDGARQVSQLQHLTTLSLSGCPISDAALADGLPPQLVQLSLENTHISDQSVQKISQHERLERLTLYGSDVTDAGVPALANLKSLKSVMLGDTSVSPAALLDLQGRRPDLYISPSPSGQP